MYAIIATGGKQYKVDPGMLLDVERLKDEVGSKIRIEEVLAVQSDDKLEVGRPHLKGAAVVMEVVDHPRGPKVINFKFKRRKGYQRKIGHRQELTRLKVLEIVTNGTH